MRKFCYLGFALLVSACASQRVIIDKEGVDLSRYEQDLSECREYAEEVPAGSEVAKGAAGGAVVGAAIGAIVGGGEAARKAGAVGAVAGGARGGRKSKEEKNQIVKNCLKGRGYKVLN